MRKLGHGPQCGLYEGDAQIKSDAASKRSPVSGRAHVAFGAFGYPKEGV